MRKSTSGFLSAQVLAKSRCQLSESPLSVPILSEILPPDGAAAAAGALVGVAAVLPPVTVVVPPPDVAAGVVSAAAGAAPAPHASRIGNATARAPVSVKKLGPFIDRLVTRESTS